MSDQSISVAERIVSCISYITGGWGGVICLLIMLVFKLKVTKFLRFHLTQAIFLAILLYLISTVFGIIMKFLAIIPFLNTFVAYISFNMNRAIFFDYSIIQVFIFGLIIYLSVFSLLGKCPKVYFISDILIRGLKK